jgi:hypothetical protein
MRIPARGENSLTRWVAKVPIHWKICRLGSVANVTLSNVDKHTVVLQIVVNLHVAAMGKVLL